MAWTKYGCKGSEIFWIEQIKIAFLVRFFDVGHIVYGVNWEYPNNIRQAPDNAAGERYRGPR